MRRAIASLILATLVATLAACGDDGTTNFVADAADTSASPDTLAPDTSPPDVAPDELPDAPSPDATPPCTSTCTTIGARRCDGATIEVCREVDACLVWQASSVCEAPLICSQGQCATSCSDGCSVAGARKCEGDAVVTCGDPDQDGCLDWDGSSACEAGQTCSTGACALDCSDECDVAGTKACEGGGVKTCGAFDADPCLEWGDAVPCGAGATCSNGFCSATCSDECARAGEVQCSGGGVSTCGAFDADPCLEWGDPVACEAERVCVGGACVETCTSECGPLGARVCATGGYRTCGDDDGDGCLTWSATVACGATASCVEGACLSAGPPAVVLVSEVYYDSPGADAGTFVELYGPPGTALAGYEIVGVNGGNGEVYSSLALDGAIGPDGLYLVVDDLAGSELLALADLVHTAANHQNGPDNVQVRWGDVVVDAVGFGTFGADDLFAGEGDPAPGASPGKSIARDERWSDSDDNAADFRVASVPTPGAHNVEPVAESPPVAALACPGSATVGVEVTLDAAASHDDGDLVSWSFDFGDGTSSGTLAVPTTRHAWTAAGSYLVRVTVIDDDGLADDATCTVDVADDVDPVDPVDPVEGDAPPGASFTVTANTATIAILDAGAAWDRETADDALEVRWDFQADGSWDTAWSTTRVATHAYGSAGPHTARLEVRDGAGQVASAQRTFTLSALEYVSGTVTTDTWSGTVVVQGDVRVPEGEVLTVLPGTRVLAVYLPQGDAGTVGIRIEGRLDVQGTAELPVLFSVYGDTHREPRAWQGIELAGAGSSLVHTVVEYAVTGVQAGNAADLELSDCVVRRSSTGVAALSGATLDVTRCSIVDSDLGLTVSSSSPAANVTFSSGVVARNASGGVRVAAPNGGLGLNASDVYDNGGPGVALSGGALSVIQSYVRRNTVGIDSSASSYSNMSVNLVGSELSDNDVGLAVRGRASATVSYSRIVDNRLDGVVVDTSTSAQTPVTSITHSDLAGNGWDGASVIADPGITVATTYEWDDGYVDSPLFTTDGGPILAFHVSYSEGSYNGAIGYVATGDDRTLFIAMDDTPARWVTVDDATVVDLRGRVYDTISGYRASLVVYAVWYRSAASDAQVAIVRSGEPVVLTNNWWGAATSRVTALSSESYDASSPASGPVLGAGVP